MSSVFVGMAENIPKLQHQQWMPLEQWISARSQLLAESGANRASRRF
jgi:hypothetical protein